MRQRVVFFPVSEWFAAFLLTLGVELPVVLLLLRRRDPSLPRLATLVLIANLATHPAVWFVFTQLLDPGTLEYTLVAEAWAVGMEAVVYAVTIQGLGWAPALGVALLANGASWLVGWMVGARWLGLVG